MKTTWMLRLLDSEGTFRKSIESLPGMDNIRQLAIVAERKLSEKINVHENSYTIICPKCGTALEVKVKDENKRE